MASSSQEGRSNQRERTRRALVEGALRVVEAGRIPSVAEAAEASGISRATAYRYFSDAPSLLSAVLEDTVTPVRWDQLREHAPAEVMARVDLFLDEAQRIIADGEAQLRAALRVALEQRAADINDPASGDSLVQRGTRMKYLPEVLAPLRDQLPQQRFDRLVTALAMIWGIEAYVVLRDICDLTLEEASDVVRWTAGALVRTAIEDGRGPAAGGGALTQ